MGCKYNLHSQLKELFIKIDPKISTYALVFEGPYKSTSLIPDVYQKIAHWREPTLPNPNPATAIAYIGNIGRIQAGIQ